ncbi:hypothetical protein ABIA39_000285 [Nocardia sp. GAS34]|uniref:hypothetical protein n=1 Tax=unclassified Nocardia TaxID=2637762 RepID=UPI003D1F796C
MPSNQNGPHDHDRWPLTSPGTDPELDPYFDPEADEDDDEVQEIDLDTGPVPELTDQDTWFIPPSDPVAEDAPVRTHRRVRRVPVRAWAALAACAAVVFGVLAAVLDPTHPPGSRAGKPASTASPRTSPRVSGACAGLSGTVVTDRAGDPATVAGVIATFEAAYYDTRSGEQAARLLAPEAGITPQALGAGIASIPAGTTHCVSITLIAPATADVHLAEVHPDGTRVDYLQLINTRPTPGGMLITHVQSKG